MQVGAMSVKYDVLDDDTGEIIEHIEYDITLTKKDIGVLKSLMFQEEKRVMLANLTNVRASQEKDKTCRTLYKLLGHERS